MEKEGIERMEARSSSGSQHNSLSFINDFLPVSFPGRVVKMRHARSEFTLRGSLTAIVEFDDFGDEEIDMEVPEITNDFDIFTSFANCITERLVHLKARKGKDLSTLVQNLYKGVLKS
jgi:hypothetical protein